MGMISAKEAFEGTLARSSRIKEEKLKLVDTGIRAAVEQELLSTKFTFAQLKPFAGVVVETLTELGFNVSQTGAFIFVSWAPKKVEPVKVEAKKPATTDEADYGNGLNVIEDDDDEDDFEDEDNDIWNS